MLLYNEIIKVPEEKEDLVMCVSQTANQRPPLSHTFKAEMAEGQLQHKASFILLSDLHEFLTETVLSAAVATLVTPSGHF